MSSHQGKPHTLGLSRNADQNNAGLRWVSGSSALALVLCNLCELCGNFRSYLEKAEDLESSPSQSKNLRSRRKTRISCVFLSFVLIYEFIQFIFTRECLAFLDEHVPHECLVPVAIRRWYLIPWIMELQIVVDHVGARTRNQVLWKNR